jgi:hypothetical protein
MGLAIGFGAQAIEIWSIESAETRAEGNADLSEMRILNSSSKDSTSCLWICDSACQGGSVWRTQIRANLNEGVCSGKSLP